MKYSPSVRSKLALKLKMLRINWNLAYLIFQICWFWFKCKKNYEIFTSCYAQIGPKIENAQNLLKFGTFDISNIPISFNVENNFYQIFLSNFNFCQISINFEHFSFWDQSGPNRW